jgi:hypothetical protein
MKKIAAAVILFLFAALAWNLFVHPAGMMFNIDGEEIDGPLGALLGAMFAGGGLLVAGAVMVFVGLLLALVFAGVGIVVVAALALAAMVTALALSPLMLPLLIPVGIVWLLMGRSRRNRTKAGAV